MVHTKRPTPTSSRCCQSIRTPTSRRSISSVAAVVDVAKVYISLEQFECASCGLPNNNGNGENEFVLAFPKQKRRRVYGDARDRSSSSLEQYRLQPRLSKHNHAERILLDSPIFPALSLFPDDFFSANGAKSSENLLLPRFSSSVSRPHDLILRHDDDKNLSKDGQLSDFLENSTLHQNLFLPNME